MNIDLQNITIQEIVAGVKYAGKVLEDLEKRLSLIGTNIEEEKELLLYKEEWTKRLHSLIGLIKNRIDLIIQTFELHETKSTKKA